MSFLAVFGRFSAGFSRAAAVVGLGIGAVLMAGCSGPLPDSEFPNLNVRPPPVRARLLTPDQQAAVIADLKAKARTGRRWETE